MESFEELLENNKYQVFIFSSPVPIPFNFAVHTWFVINLKGEIHRWEFGKFRGSPHPNGVGILRDYLEPTRGMPYYFWKTKKKFKSKLVDYIEGDIAKQLAKFIEGHSNDYPFKNIYSLTGPNSNTYMQWVLNKFPKSNLKLPFNAFGKNYKIKE